MGGEELLEIADRLVFTKTGKHLDQPQKIILREFWRDHRRRYQDIAEWGYSEAYLKEVGSELWQLLSEILGFKVAKKTFVTALEQISRTQQSEKSTLSPIYSDFLGREREIAAIHQLVNQGAKVILLQGEGGIGKTTLARKYFKIEEFDFLLELWMATEIQNLTPIESVVEEWLQRDFNEEAGRDFGVNIERLRRKLRDPNQKIGVFIDNLETALDKNGKFLESRRPYVELLRVLADSAVHSVTLITSRERLCEASINIELYLLEGLDEDAWRQFFTSRKINSNSLVEREMCRAYGGNAKAMQILSGAILTDFQGDIDAYWHENSSDLLGERQLNDLVASQFERLKEINTEAYQLLCRLGCYRYQDITSVPIEGLSALLWDVPETQHKRLVKALQDLSLIEAKKGRYWLHSVIRTEAVNRLKLSAEWEIVNRKAADFWTQRIEVVTDITDALTALEAYYHYVEIEDFEQAGDVIILRRGKQWNIGLPLGVSFYQKGLLHKLISVIIRIIEQVKDETRLISLYNLLGYTYRLIGCVVIGLDCYQKSTPLVEKSQNERHKISILFNTALCKIDLWEIEEAKHFFNQVCHLAEQSSNFDDYIVYSQGCLAFLNSCSGLKAEAFRIAEDSLAAISTSNSLTLWGIGHNLVILGLTYKNLGYLEKSRDICQKVILDSEANKFTQIKAKAITCLAELDREEAKFPQAISNHLEAIEMLYEIGAKCDLAEAHYQIALTYQKMGKIEQSRQNIQQAIALFNEMQAPKQVEKVQKAWKE